jgi:hypothetical protein
MGLVVVQMRLYCDDSWVDVRLTHFGGRWLAATIDALAPLDGRIEVLIMTAPAELFGRRSRRLVADRTSLVSASDPRAVALNRVHRGRGLGSRNAGVRPERRRLKVMAANRRHVVPNPKGGWDVKKPGADRSSGHFDTQEQAVNRAREILGRSGGGELTTHGTDGAIRDSDTIPPG